MVRQTRIRRYLTQHDQPALQVGGGQHVLAGWLNGDLIAGDIYLDARQRLPFPDNSLDYIFGEQFLEHLTFQEGQDFLAEAYRVLKPGGLMRQSTPNCRGVVDVYQAQNPMVSQETAVLRHRLSHNPDCDNACQFLNDFFHLWGHRFLYDRPTLAVALEKAGFRNLQWQLFGLSEHPMLRGRERHADVAWMQSAFILICEVQK